MTYGDHYRKVSADVQEGKTTNYIFGKKVLWGDL